MALSDDLFQSIDTIVSARIANLPYDQTLECEIIKADKSYDGIYDVLYQTSTFSTISNFYNLKVGDIVYVSVPQGDFSKDKIIVAKKLGTEETTVKTRPFLSFVRGNNLVSTRFATAEYSVSLNSGIEENSPITINKFEGENEVAGFTKLGIKLSINASLPMKIRSGADYGLYIDIYGYDQSKELETSDILIDRNENHLIQRYQLGTTDMIATNLFNTIGTINQEKVFDITNYVITKINLVFYLNNKFIDEYNNSVKDLRIYFTNLQVYLGHDASEFAQKNNTKLFLYTYDGLLINSEHRQKTIHSRFLERQESDLNTYLVTPLYFNLNWTWAWEVYDPIQNNVFGKYSNVANYIILKENDRRSTSLNINPAYSSTQVKYGYIFAIRNEANKIDNNYISNQLIFINELYAGIEGEQTVDQDKIISYFTLDDTGHVVLTNSASLALPLTISNISLKGVLVLSENSLTFLLNDGTQILKLDGNTGSVFNGAAADFTTTGTIYKVFQNIANALGDLSILNVDN